MATAAAALALLVPVLVALLLGPLAFAIVVVLVAVLLLFDVSDLLARAGARPVVVVAGVPALVAPLLAARAPDVAWERLPVLFAGALFAAFALVLLFGRRRHVVEGLGATCLVALLVGLGSASLLLLRALPTGFRWVLGFLVLALAADLGPVLARALQERRIDPHERDEAPARDTQLELLASLLLLAVAGVLLAFVLQPPFTPLTAVLLALVALTAALGGAQMHGSIAAEAGAADVFRLGEGLLLGVVDGVLIGAPAVYVLARGAA